MGLLFWALGFYVVTLPVNNKFTRIPNSLLDKMCHSRISGEEGLVLLFIIRKTYGWNKPEDQIALSTFSEATGLKYQNVHRALKKLAKKNIITIISLDDSTIQDRVSIISIDDRKARIYKVNVDLGKWVL